MAVSKERKEVKILFITGVSGAGKSTVGEGLKLYFKDKEELVEVHDLDEDGVPKFGVATWRSYKVEQLFGNAIEQLQKSITTIICGTIFPYEIIQSELFNLKIPVYFVLLDITPLHITRRLRAKCKRLKKSKKFTDKYVAANKRNLTVFKNQVMMQKNGYRIDTGKFSREKVLEKIVEVVMQ